MGKLWVIPTILSLTVFTWYTSKVLLDYYFKKREEKSK